MFTVSFLAVIGMASAWDMQGHAIISLLAGNVIRNPTRLYVDTHLQNRKAKDLPRAMAYASAWADLILIKPTSKKYSATESLHFAKTVFQKCPAFDINRDCPDKKCIVTAIVNYAFRATNASLAHKQRLEALMFVLHFMGDIHQPLHLGFAEDRGATRIFIPAAKTTLHNVWDKSLLEWVAGPKRNYYDVFQEILNEIAGQKPVVLNEFAKVQSEADLLKVISEIASETIQAYTCKAAYQTVDGKWIGKNLGVGYFETRAKIMINQFVKAGFRLAFLLDWMASRFAVEQERVALRAAEKKALAKNPFFALDDEPEDEESQDNDDILELFDQIESLLK